MNRDFTVYLDNEARENVKFFAAHALTGIVGATTWISETKSQSADESAPPQLTVSAAPQPIVAKQAFDLAEQMMAEYVARVDAAVKWEAAQKAANDAAPTGSPAPLTPADEADLTEPAQIH